MRAEGGLALGGVAWEQVAPGNYWNRDLTLTSGNSCMRATWGGLGVPQLSSASARKGWSAHVTWRFVCIFKKGECGEEGGTMTIAKDEKLVATLNIKLLGYYSVMLYLCWDSCLCG